MDTERNLSQNLNAERMELEAQKIRFQIEKAKAMEEIELQRNKLLYEKNKEKGLSSEEERLKIEEERLKIELERELMKEEKKKMEELTAHQYNSPNVVKLNVGGTVFTTTLETICKGKSMLSVMFSGKFSMKPNENGEYFIDRDPTYFGHILNYLRKGTIDMGKFEQNQLIDLKEEIEYYQIESLSGIFEEQSSSVTFMPHYHGSTIQLSNDNKCALYTGRGWKGAALATQSSIFSVKLITNGSAFMIGMAPKSINLEKYNYSSNGWYLYSFDGTLHSLNEYTRRYSPSCSDSGTVIGVEWFKEKGELHFSINGKSYGLAFTGVFGDLYPAFDFYSEGCQIELN